MNKAEVFISSCVIPVLQMMDERSENPGRYNQPNVVKILTMIAAHEGQFINRRQVNGSALSYYQIEPNTLDDLYASYLSYRPEARELIDSFQDSENRYEQLENNDFYATCAARLILWRAPAPIPDLADEDGLAAYVKRYWNRSPGTMVAEKYLEDFRQFGPSREFWDSLSM